MITVSGGAALLPGATASANVTAMQAAVNAGNLALGPGSFATSGSIGYRKEQTIKGAGKSFSGTVITPAGDYSAFAGKDEAIDYTRNTFADFCIDAVNVTTAPIIEVDSAYLSTWQNVWVRNSSTPLTITNSDALTFTGYMAMENSTGDVVLIGDNARSIKFIASNFEKNPGEESLGGRFVVNGDGTANLSEVDLVACQFERGELAVISGTARMHGGKLVQSEVNLLAKSRDCMVEAAFNLGFVHDFGYSNRLINAYASNMATPLHEWPVLEETAPGSGVYGAPGDELLILATAGQVSNTGVTGGTIDVGADTSPSFSLPAMGDTYGATRRLVYSWLTGIAAADAIAITAANARIVAVRGGPSLITDSLFVGDGSAWSKDDCTLLSGVITPANSTWGIYQSLSSVCVRGRRYIAAAKFSGSANLTLGDPWDGTAGKRQLQDDGYADLYGDGDSVAMLSFQYDGAQPRIALGSLNSSAEVTVRWLMLIEA
jgi:hypothetical protein